LEYKNIAPATAFSSERAKNGKVLGEEIFCPRADGFFCPPPQAADIGFFRNF
jgi:hypothetical protein